MNRLADLIEKKRKAKAQPPPEEQRENKRQETAQAALHVPQVSKRQHNPYSLHHWRHKNLFTDLSLCRSQLLRAGHLQILSRCARHLPRALCCSLFSVGSGHQVLCAAAYE